MMDKSLQVRIRLGKVHSNNGEDYINLSVEDRVSGVRFVEAELSFTEFGKMLAGDSTETCAEVRGLENLGRKREFVAAKQFITMEQYTSVTSGLPYEEQLLALGQWLVDHHSVDGWTVQTYLGGRDSIEFCRGGYILNFRYSRHA